MDQPIFWGALLAVAVLAVVARRFGGRPLLGRLAAPIGRPALLVAGLSVLALVFHCTAMFFGPWVDAIPGAQGPADAVRDLGTASQIAYGLPAATLVLGARRIWWPGLLLITAAVGVGVTMYWPFALAIHLGWLATFIVVGSAISATLLGPVEPTGPRHDDRQPARTS